MCAIFSILDISYFVDESFTKREAWSWLVNHSTNGKVSCSLRYMATAWGWHRSKVERFLNRVKSEALIETEIKSGKLVITLGRFKHTAVTTKGGEAALEAQSEAITRQNRGIIANKRQLRDESENAETKKISAIPWGVEAI